MKELLAKFKLRSTDDVYSAAGKAEFRGEERLKSAELPVRSANTEAPF